MNRIDYPLTEFEKVEKSNIALRLWSVEWNCPSQLDKGSSFLKTIINGAYKKKTERMKKKFISRLIDVDMLCHDLQGLNKVAHQAM